MSYHRAVLAAAVLALNACSGPRVDIDAEKAVLVARSDSLVAAESAMDIEASLAYWAPDALIQGHGIPLMQGTDQLRTVYDGFFQAVVEFGSTRTGLDVAASGDMAWEYGVNRAVVPGADGTMLDMGKYVAIWRKIDGVWYLAAVAFSSDAAAPSPM